MNTCTEVWVGAIYQGVDYSWRFEVSSFGRLRSITGRIYALGYGAGGYLHACISICGKRLNVRPHRCVAESFLPNPYGYEIVNHIDGCKQNNRLENLEWCTREENYYHALRTDLIDFMAHIQLGKCSRMGAFAGSWNGMAKLSENDVRYIRANYVPKGKGQQCNRKHLAAQFGVTVGLISQIIKYEIWTHVA